MKRLVLPWLAGLVACTSTPPAPREPAALPADPAVSATFRETVAVTALVLGAPDARGERQPLCQVDLLDHPDLAPGFLTPTTSRQDFALNLPTCSAEQQSEIFKVATHAGRPIFAGPGDLLYRCGLNFTVAATIMTAYTATYRTARRNSIIEKITPTAATQTAVIVVSGKEFLKKSPQLGPRTLMAFVCTGAGALAGQGIGYLLAPR